MQLALTIVLLLALAAGSAAQCTGSDHPNCASWKKNGYCTNAGTSLEQRKMYCGVSCGLCNTDGTQTAVGGGTVVPACVDSNPNCAAWQLQSPPFCANPSYSSAMKQQYCCQTCSALPTACAVLYDGTGAPAMNTGVVVGAMPVPALSLTKVYVKQGCTLKLYKMDFVTPTVGSPFRGSDNFSDLTGDATTAAGFECAC